MIAETNATTELMTLFVSDESGTEFPSMDDALIACAPHSLPTIVNRAEAYYWTRAWQAGEAESLAEIQRGEVESFTGGAAAVRWLLSEDD